MCQLQQRDNVCVGACREQGARSAPRGVSDHKDTQNDHNETQDDHKETQRYATGNKETQNDHKKT